MQDASMEMSVPDQSVDAIIDANLDSEVNDATADLSVDATPDAIPDAISDATPDAMFTIAECDSLSGALYCASFEDDLSEWSVTGPTAVSTLESFSGASSVRSQTAMAGETTSIFRSFATPITGPEFFFRLRLLPIDRNITYTFFAVVESASPNDGFDLNIDNGGIGLYSFKTRDDIVTTNKVNYGDWNCVNGRVSMADTNGVFEVGLNGQAPVALVEDTMTNSGQYNSVQGGITYLAPNGGPTTVFIDDIVFSDTELPCP